MSELSYSAKHYSIKSEKSSQKAETFAQNAEASAISAANSVNNLADYLGQIENKTNESINQIDTAVFQRLQVVSALPSNPVEGVFYFIKE